MSIYTITLAFSRRLPFFLRIYLDSRGDSSGELYWDDGDSVDAYEAGAFNHVTFGCSGASKLTSVVERNGYRAENMTLDFVSVFGLGTKPTSVTLDGREVKFFYSEKIQASGAQVASDLRKKLGFQWSDVLMRRKRLTNTTTFENTIKNVKNLCSTGRLGQNYYARRN